MHWLGMMKVVVGIVALDAVKVLGEQDDPHAPVSANRTAIPIAFDTWKASLSGR